MSEPLDYVIDDRTDRCDSDTEYWSDDDEYKEYPYYTQENPNFSAMCVTQQQIPFLSLGGDLTPPLPEKGKGSPIDEIDLVTPPSSPDLECIEVVDLVTPSSTDLVTPSSTDLVTPVSVDLVTPSSPAWIDLSLKKATAKRLRDTIGVTPSMKRRKFQMDIIRRLNLLNKS